MSSLLLIFLTLGALGLPFALRCESASDFNADEMIDYINNKANTSWIAGKNPRFESLDQFKQLLGTIIPTEPDNTLPYKALDDTIDDELKSLPKQFDARQQWSHCHSLTLIRDQSACGSCWAIAAVETMSDRICIASGGQVQPVLSTRDLLSCCPNCGHGCQGGYYTDAWSYWVKQGIVSGGFYHSKIGCQPYPFPPCSHTGRGPRPPCPSKLYPTPQCVRKCEAGSGLDYNQDKYFGANAYIISPYQDTIKRELMRNGPLEVSFMVYSDFSLYRSGIYRHVSGAKLGGHAVKLIGWGEEKGIPYWLLANSWNTDWGENGYFRMLRGYDECGIEDLVVGGIP